MNDIAQLTWNDHRLIEIYLYKSMGITYIFFIFYFNLGIIYFGAQRYMGEFSCTKIILEYI